VTSEAPPFSVLADVAIVKGETPADDLAWLSFPDGTARREAVHASRDLPHLAVESAFGLGDGLWGTMAAGEHGEPVSPAASEPVSPAASEPVSPATRAPVRPAARAPVRRTAGRRDGHLRLVTAVDAALTGRATARAAVNAVVNRWGDGPDTPAGVRARLSESGTAAAELGRRLTDEQVRLACAGARRLCRDWAGLPAGGTLRATWPLHDSWLRLLLCPASDVAAERHCAAAGHWLLVHECVDPI
jgi:hypothetical protein